jgi:DNA-binding MarR family transcriptional regulator
MSSTQPRPSKTRHFDSLEQEAFLNLWRTYDRLHIAEEELFDRYQLTPQQYNVLRLLRSEHPGKLPTLVLAQHLVSRAPDITRMLDKLASRNLIDRERPAENRRTVLVRITKEGLALLRELNNEVRACHRRQLGHLSAAQLRQLVELLHLARAPHEEPGSNWA